ncbi:uncharacterized protein MELLADRAFT_62662 [Melampsora larici-populina 98AG31]|uniref:N-alpha-acetyltransferase 60 n=1 Tax=Melampsora larici-populina (strain 98AG31 / pathotype 3-4-7) TaxID=747676 RepID=F4RJR0_MELLP|nr:uncharacterized protein MELLADRAFT_62662 [Melampsora larici-populina 98AG31]EGG07356.1 hypothetical protein MELLADRAFT_62662 [Melampsora larici-populina 98AG31]
MNGPWLSLLPVTDPKPFKPSTINPSSSCDHSNQIKFKSNKRPALHTHNHHPTSNSILKPMILETRPKLKKTVHTHILSNHTNSNLINHSFDSSFKLKSSNLLLNSRSVQDDHEPFEIRNLKVADLEKVKELHHSTLPITYPTSFFCNLLMKQENDIALVATLPSSLPAGYFDLKVQESNSNQIIKPDLLHTNHHHHHLLHHVTSPLSGKKPISLDIIGSITSTFKPETKEIRILTLCVDHQYRRHGLGQMLIKELIIKTRQSTCQSNRVSLHVQATNSIALKFYLRLGFKKMIFKESYYSNQALKPLNHSRSTTSSSTCTSSTSTSSPASVSASTSTCTSDDGLDDDSNSKIMVKDIDAWFLVLDLSTS